VEFFSGIIRSKILNLKRKQPNKAQVDRDNRTRMSNDIRYKDPKTLKLYQLTQYNTTMAHYTQEQREEFVRKGKEMRNEI